MMTEETDPVAGHHGGGKALLLRLVAALGQPVNGMLGRDGDRIDALDEIGLGRELLHRLRLAQRGMLASPGESASALIFEGLAQRLATDLQWLEAYEDQAREDQAYEDQEADQDTAS